ncbi:MAG: hypothetical protein A2W05_03000 [Candidatus Schekmanbacteria bacterium RBG_16_38_10]|uniref:Uncharacterized protein n=1 Tax=Candidatus Schekmanbacteria bacterium RBG_16_38_10 TaxID=1817879 RepID=A0A1F7S107_9BACT|nr:MAG: hypothetical protein A2W05_03000 [Candidatus Schekmanbacteria bacterium RBG_16_38_10]
MKFLKIIFFVVMLITTAVIVSALTKTAVVIDGNTLFNNSIKPQEKPYKHPYTDKELVLTKTNSERGSKLFLLTKDGTLYYPVPKPGVSSIVHLNQNMNAPRITRIFSKEVQAQIKAQNKKKITWLTLVHVVGHEVEVTGDIYPGYSGVKGINIKTIKCDDPDIP